MVITFKYFSSILSKGIFSPDDNETYYKVKNFIKNGINALREKYPDDLALYPIELAAFYYPPSFHVTVLYIGGNESLAQSVYWKDFVDGYHVNVTGKFIIKSKLDLRNDFRIYSLKNYVYACISRPISYQNLK